MTNKGRAITDLESRHSDGAEELPIRLAGFQVSNHSPLVIPSEVEGSAVRLARTQKSREARFVPLEHAAAMKVGDRGKDKP
jgi:hypothetical protein